MEMEILEDCHFSSPRKDSEFHLKGCISERIHLFWIFLRGLALKDFLPRGSMTERGFLWSCHVLQAALQANKQIWQPATVDEAKEHMAVFYINIYFIFFLCCQMSWHKNSWENALQLPGSLRGGSLFINKKASRLQNLPYDRRELSKQRGEKIYPRTS